LENPAGNMKEDFCLSASRSVIPISVSMIDKVSTNHTKWYPSCFIEEFITKYAVKDE
jgi:hypothetical protein